MSSLCAVLLAYLNPRIPPPMRDKIRRTRNTKKTIFAIPAAPAAIPPKPNMAAINAITKNKMANRNIIVFI